MLTLLCVTQEQHLMTDVTRAFPEVLIHIEFVKEVGQCTSTTGKPWDVLILDLDGMPYSETDLMSKLQPCLQHARKAIAIVPPRFASIETALRQLNVTILHKPITTGELVLTLNPVIRQATENGKRGKE